MSKDKKRYLEVVDEKYSIERCDKCTGKDLSQLPFSQDVGLAQIKNTYFKRVPQCLKDLSEVEATLISRIAPVMRYWKTKYLHRVYRGYCMNKR